MIRRNGLPTIGLMQFDSDDIVRLKREGLLQKTIVSFLFHRGYRYMSNKPTNSNLFVCFLSTRFTVARNGTCGAFQYILDPACSFMVNTTPLTRTILRLNSRSPSFVRGCNSWDWEPCGSPWVWPTVPHRAVATEKIRLLATNIGTSAGAPAPFPWSKRVARPVLAGTTTAFPVS